MSELKARTARSIADAEEMLELGADCHIEPSQVYLKFEADKVIAELKAENERLRGESCKLTDGCLRLKQCRKEKANIADELRHSNHKRCMAMARWCRESLRLMRTYEVTDDFWNLEPGQDAEYFCKKGDFYSKWRNRWLALAEEPTWAKFLQLIHKEAK